MFCTWKYEKSNSSFKYRIFEQFRRKISTTGQPKTSSNLKFFFIEIAHRRALLKKNFANLYVIILFFLGGNNNSLRSSLRKTMVNTNYGYSVAINNNSSGDNSSNHNMEDFRVMDDCRQNQQSSPDSQYEGDSGSLSVMRRREPLGASGNKPERPK